MSPKQAAQMKAMAQAILAITEQVNRLTDSALNLHSRLQKVEEHPGVSIPPLEPSRPEIVPG